MKNLNRKSIIKAMLQVRFTPEREGFKSRYRNDSLSNPSDPRRDCWSQAVNRANQKTNTQRHTDTVENNALRSQKNDSLVGS